MRFLISSLVVLADAGFASGLASFLATANIPHTAREMGEALGACIFWLVLQLWQRHQTVHLANRVYDLRAAAQPPLPDEQAPQPPGLGQ